MAVTLNASLADGLITSGDTTGNLNIQSNGTTVLGITSAGATVTGNLGIGTASITGGYKAQINGNLLLGITANPSIVGTTSLSLYGDNTSSAGLKIDTAGNVGIGTSSPGSKLDVVGTATISRTSANTSLYLTASGVANTVLGFNNSGADDFGVINNATYFGNRQAYPIVFIVNETERMRIDSNGYVTVPNQPAFYAQCGGTGPSGFSSPTTAQFGTVVTNIGNNYNNSTHRFTAPIAGRYLLSVSVSFGNNSTLNTWIAARFRKNGSYVSVENYMLGHVSNTGSNNHYDTVGGTIIIYLTAGDYIDIALEHNTFNGNMIYGHFCGYLIS